MVNKIKNVPAVDSIDHIECILPEGCDVEREVNSVLRTVCENGRESVYVTGTASGDSNDPIRGTVVAVGHTDGIQVVVAADNRGESTKLGSFYPIGKPLEDVERRSGDCRFLETQNDLEGYGYMPEENLTFLVANYPEIKERCGRRTTSRLDVDLIGFCYSCHTVTSESPKNLHTLDLTETAWYEEISPEKRAELDRSWNVGEDKKVTFDFTYMKYFYQKGGEFPDEFVFASPVYAIDELEVFGLPMYRMKIQSKEACFEDEQDKYITVYAKKMIFPNEVKVGDFVKGVGWLQGVVG